MYWQVTDDERYFEVFGEIFLLPRKVRSVEPDRMRWGGMEIVFSIGLLMLRLRVFSDEHGSVFLSRRSSAG